MYTTMKCKFFGFFALFYRLNLRKNSTFWVLGVKYTLLQRSKKSKTALCYRRNLCENSFFGYQGWGGGGQIYTTLEVKKVKICPLLQAKLEGKFTFWVFGWGGFAFVQKNKKLYQYNFEFTMKKKPSTLPKFFEISIK